MSDSLIENFTRKIIVFSKNNVGKLQVSLFFQTLSTLHKLTSTKQIPHYKSRGGKINYYDKAELTEWMLSCRIKTTDVLEDEALAYITFQK